MSPLQSVGKRGSRHLPTLKGATVGTRPSVPNETTANRRPRAGVLATAAVLAVLVVALLLA